MTQSRRHLRLVGKNESTGNSLSDKEVPMITEAPDMDQVRAKIARQSFRLMPDQIEMPKSVLAAIESAKRQEEERRRDAEKNRPALIEMPDWDKKD